MKYLLDTNTCVQYLRKGSASLIAAILTSLSVGDVMLCTIVFGELLFGALRSRDVATNLAEVRKFIAGFPLLDFHSSAAETYANIRADLAANGKPIGPNDLLIAAIAVTNGLRLITHNTAEFSRVAGLTLEDW